MVYESYKVRYQDLNLRVYRDGAGLDIEGLDDKALADIKLMDTGATHRLFCILAGSSDLIKDLESAGAEVIGVEKAGILA